MENLYGKLNLTSSNDQYSLAKIREIHIPLISVIQIKPEGQTINYRGKRRES